MALKRWNSPQRKSLFEDENVKYGDYISFSNYHFVDIIDIPPGIGHSAQTSSQKTLLGTYNALSRLRDSFQSTSIQDTHIVQVMPLLGRENSFWDCDIGVLYITFIQLSSFASISFENLQSSIEAYWNENIKTSKKHPQFALYQSLDFCDYVLFTKDIKLDQLQNLLWGLTLRQDICKDCIRDTFTVYSFGWDYLNRSFQNLELASLNDTTTATINLSIQSSDVIQELQNKLIAENIPFSKQKMCGRYDLSLTSPQLPHKSVLRILQIIDCFNHSSKTTDDIKLGGYEVVLTPEGCEDNYTGGLSAKRDTELRDSGVFYLETWNQICGNQVYNNKSLEIHKIANYIIETLCSIKELLENGFADEFILCVLPSLATVLDISLEYSQKCTVLNEASKKDFDTFDLIRSIKKNLHNLWRNYFTALNTLSLCTMHSERQFIQSPAFNASYFEIPPKLLAYYNAIVNDIVEKLNTTSSETYRFVIAPDFRDDINVTDLPIASQPERSSHIAIINLNESFIYMPSKAVLLFAHEVAHYVGNRNRSQRTHYIFKSISLKMLQQTVLFRLAKPNENSTDSEDLVAVLCEAMGDFLFELYEEFCGNEQIPYHSKSVNRFLKNSEYGLSFLRDPFLRDRLAASVLRHLLESTSKSPILMNQLIEGIISIEQALQTNFYSNTLSTEPDNTIPYLLFSNKVPLILKELDDQRETYQGKKAFEAIYRYLDEVVCSFFEAYADHKMFELCGVCNGSMFEFARSAYEELLHDLTGCNTLQHFLRHESVLGTLSCVYNSPENSSPDTQVQKRIVNYITEYINGCEPLESTSILAYEAISVFADANLQEQYNHINQVIKEYRQTTIEMCKEKSIGLMNKIPMPC